MTLRPYQKEIAEKASLKILDNMVVYLAMEVRTGKTVTALETAKLYNSTNVLFITKKKAINDILEDYEKFQYNEIFEITVINNESLHKVEGDFDFLISDEHHRNGAFPKPNKVTKLIKQRYSDLPMVFLSGTPHPESYSQIYHQFWVSDNSPFDESNFYKWAQNYVDVKLKYLGHGQVKDYSTANYEKLKPIIDQYFITYTQKEAGFESTINETVLYCDLEPFTYELIKRFTKDQILEGKNEVVLGDTAAKMQSKLHQMFSGTIKFESGASMVLDKSKAQFIFAHFYGQKIGIFYKFKEELNAIKQTFGDLITTDLQEFKETNKSIALQIVSGRSGITLKQADALVYYNIDFSSLSYWQSRDRMTTKERTNNNVFWIFSKGGIEDKIYKSVLKKKDYTVNVFKKDYEFSK